MSGRKVKSQHVPPPKRWYYSGDVNIEHGGMFMQLHEWANGFVNVVRVQPCSDAGGPDNMWWVESLSILLPDLNLHFPFWGAGVTVDERKATRVLHDVEDHPFEPALISCGWDTQLDAWDKLTVHAKRCAMVEAAVGYGLYDQEWSEPVRIGDDWPFFDGNHADWPVGVQLRGNSSLRAYVKRRCNHQ
jgi:hypothetical protein